MAKPRAKKQDKRSDRERVYDEEIAPLMTKIIEACGRAQIPFAAQFSIGPAPDGNPSWLCTSMMVFDDAQIRKVADVMKPRSTFVALTISGGKPSAQ